MGIWDKLAFWKKSDDFGLGDLNTDFSTPPPASSYNPPQQEPSFSQNSFSSPYGSNDFTFQPSTSPSPSAAPSKDIELISSKLDAIKAMLDSINQRLATVERVALQEEADQKKGKRGW